MNKTDERQEEFWFTLIRSGNFRNLWNPQLEVLFLLKGKGRIYFANTKTSYTVREEDIFVINSFEIHNLELQENATALSFSISLRFLYSVSPELMKYQVSCRSFLYGNNLGEVPQILIPVIGILMAGTAVWITLKVPEENRSKALRYAAAALIYFLLVIFVMNSLKTVWGRMRFREMTDPVNEFTRWYQIRGRGSFDNAYASFPSGHSMNSAGVILTLLLPDLIPAWKDKQKPLRICTYAWCIIVGASRVLMGAHFASDVTVGILLSFLLFELTYTLICRRKGAM